MAKSHTTKFKWNNRSGYFLAECTCGWSHLADTLAECQTRAATHDLEWVEISVDSKENHAAPK